MDGIIIKDKIISNGPLVFDKDNYDCLVISQKRKPYSQSKSHHQVFFELWGQRIDHAIFNQLVCGALEGAIYGGQPLKREVDHFIERHGRIN